MLQTHQHQPLNHMLQTLQTQHQSLNPNQTDQTELLHMPQKLLMPHHLQTKYKEPEIF
jgi:hypothetical protein